MRIESLIRTPYLLVVRLEDKEEVYRLIIDENRAVLQHLIDEPPFWKPVHELSSDRWIGVSGKEILESSWRPGRGS